MPNASTAIVVNLVVLTVGVLLLLWRSYFPSYLSEKGKNLATMEDIAKITAEVESVKAIYATKLQTLEHQNALLIEELRSNQQLRMAATERRLEAHQHAFTLWRILLSRVNEDNTRGIVAECQQWWERNCLYLTADARDSFNRAYVAAADHHYVMQDRSNPDLVTRNFSTITKAGDDIVAGVELPPLGKRESEDATRGHVV